MNIRSDRICAIIFFAFLVFQAVSVFAAGIDLSWEPPSTNADGSPITGLTGYKIYYGTISGYYTKVIDTGNVRSFRVANLNAGAYYFALTAYNNQGVESSLSNEVEVYLQGDGTPGSDDQDMDGIPDDGDGSGISGDNTCTEGNTVNCDDNCRRVYNPDQRDSNGPRDDNRLKPGVQHYGDACDPDFNNDGRVNKKDLKRLRKYLGKRTNSSLQYLNLNGDGMINSRDLKILKKYYRKPPGP